MASASLLIPSPSPLSRRLASPHRLALLPLRLPQSPRLRSPRPLAVAAASSSSPSPLQALIFDCDGVILESEHLHRQAYNDAFEHFAVRCPPSSSQPLYWGSEFYDELQNRIGGGKPKMRWYFGENGWPSSSIFETPPASDSDREKLVDVLQASEINIFACFLTIGSLFLQDWKTERYKEIIRSGSVEPRPGVLQLMDDAKGAGIKVAVCSAATKSSVILSLENLLGLERFQGLDCFLAGDDVKAKKPDPLIYITALKAANGAGMSCIITYTSSTANQDFSDAIATYPDLSNVRLEDLKSLLQSALVASG
ncbi:haloacid dehalogenase-like hydrolase [Musa troglodytarum]|uniref:Haloacid dehalogenase-like hydrolase n=1 Tax=Musa troglodytarum TaxID=320322 RepID=A0A9E7IDC0_9LILI|nr:haloacid dehalogenase-like hydrolase [Musa troglodytarum]